MMIIFRGKLCPEEIYWNGEPEATRVERYA